MSNQVSKLNPKWISATRKYFLDFLEATDFPHPERHGKRGGKFDYPEWMIMFIAVLAVKCKVKSYLGIHKLAVQYWKQIAKGLDVSPISESQLRDRLKKIRFEFGKPAGFIQQVFLRVSSINEASADKMMTRARGGIWHKKDKANGIVPNGLTGLDKSAMWSYSKADGWIYGHASFALVSHKVPVLLQFKWMPNSASEAKRLEPEIVKFADLIDIVCMDSKADDEKMMTRLKTGHDIKLLTVPRSKMDKSEARKQMIAEQMKPENRHIYKQRSVTVEPMQGLVKDLFELDRCWMRGDESNRWLFAAMGIAVQMAQRSAYLNDTSTWNIKNEVLGL